ncbi:MAG: hypothetical protein GC184_05135 [Rhizobiales bacterium]|nr:hypothetical protein [Hyphomicrobiales bacterium]
MSWDITFEPALPVLLISLMALLGAALTLFSAWRRARGTIWRTAALVLILLALINPTIRTEEREPLSDVVALIVDKSLSQQIGNRNAETDAALATLEKHLKEIKGLDVRVTTVQGDAANEEGTALFGALDEILADVPRERVAGAILITDGEVHDVPANPAAVGFKAPIHSLIIGRKNEKDRRLTITEAPSFGIVDEPLTLSFRVDETATSQVSGERATVTVSIDGQQVSRTDAEVGKVETIPLTLTHGGPNVIEIDLDKGPDELTLLNNRAVVIANGIRDRLRVLLVSGAPHPGERTWRNLLNADPSVDLVHFTILRPPEKFDSAPLDELSLIAFPVRELFVDKLDQFDLIIFDRYKQRAVLPLAYFANIADYVENGGALLAAAGPTFASPYSIYRTPLSSVLPAQPTGEISVGGYRAEMTDAGKRHPVTADLPGSDSTPPAWGRWFRTIDTTINHGEVLLEDPAKHPLMVLDHVGKGRVAQLLSDQVWLWSRGYEGGGPQAELLRRLAHWLMKEPDLEEENLSAVASNNSLTLRRRTMAPAAADATVTFPSGKTETLKLSEVTPGRFEAATPARELGLYRITQGDMTAVAAAGPLNPREYADVRATDERLAPVAKATGGGIYWAGDGGTDIPAIRSLRPGHDAAGSNWMGLNRNEQYLVRSVHQLPLVSGLIALALILGALAMAWRREGQ